MIQNIKWFENIYAYLPGGFHMCSHRPLTIHGFQIYHFSSSNINLDFFWLFIMGRQKQAIHYYCKLLTRKNHEGSPVHGLIQNIVWKIFPWQVYFMIKIKSDIPNHSAEIKYLKINDSRWPCHCFTAASDIWC